VRACEHVCEREPEKPQLSAHPGIVALNAKVCPEV